MRVLEIAASLKIGGDEKIARDIGYYSNSDIYQIDYVVFGDEIGEYEKELQEKGEAKANREAELKRTVTDIVDAICSTLSAVKCMYPQIQVHLHRDVTFVTAQELEDLYPDFTGKERENAYVKEHPTTFIIGIGGKLKSGKPHDGRAPDYDDWTLNGDILVYYPVLDIAFELSSMGIRVDEEALVRQLSAAGCPERAELPFHRQLLSGNLPYTMGGGIGQSRMCMFFLRKAHIGEVQSSYWEPEMIRECTEKGICLL